MKLGFCARCWNYVDFCDCINYEYDLETEPEKVIPLPPEDKNPEVGTVWYFRSPIVETSLGLESANASKFGLGVLLSIESLWTIEPPPGDPSMYLSIPVERLPLNQTMDTMKPGTFNKYLQPWELNYTNYQGPVLEDVKTLAEALARCSSSRAPKACRVKEMLKHAFDSYKIDEIPVPQGLIDKLSSINAYVDPEVLLAIIVAFFPEVVLSKLNEYTATAIDYDWVHRHLMDSVDPDEGYRDKKQSYIEAFKDRDLFNAAGFYDFPLPSVSIAAGTTFTIATDRSLKRTLPDRSPPFEPGGPGKGKRNVQGYSCTGSGTSRVCKPLKKGAHGTTAPTSQAQVEKFSNRSAVRPVFDDIVLYESDDEDYFYRKADVFLLPNPTAANLVAKGGDPACLFPSENPGTTRYPVMFQVLVNAGKDLVAFHNHPCCELNVISPVIVECKLVTQTNAGFTRFTFIGVSTGLQNGLLGRVFRFRRQVGTEPTLIFTQDGSTTNVNAVSGELNYTVNFQSTRNDRIHFMYKHVFIKGLSTVNSEWIVDQPTGPTGLFHNGALLNVMNTVGIIPSASGPYTPEGFLSNSSMLVNTTYRGKDIQCQPQNQVPIMFNLKNEVNMLATSPNTVPAGTFGYCAGRTGLGTIGPGTPFLPFDPVGVTSIVTYQFSVQRQVTNGTIITSNLVYNI